MLTVSEKAVGRSAGDIELLYRRREKLVSWYTLRALTYGRDKLIALSGVAKVMSDQFGGDDDNMYLAGLWEKDLLRGLMWYVFFAGRKDKKPSEYYTPSWSWASVDGPIEYDLFLECVRSEDLIPETGICRAESTLQDGDPFGRVSGGREVLCGPLKKTAWIRDPGSSNPTEILSEERVNRALKERDGRGIAQIYVDTNLDIPDSTVYCLRLFRSRARQGQPERLYGLILHPAGPDKEEYIRVGCFRAENQTESSQNNHSEAWVAFEGGLS